MKHLNGVVMVHGVVGLPILFTEVIPVKLMSETKQMLCIQDITLNVTTQGHLEEADSSEITVLAEIIVDTESVQHMVNIIMKEMPAYGK